MKIDRFENIIAWQKAKLMTIAIYELFEQCKDFSLKDQIQRASVSVMNNIAEGFERKTNNEFKQFLYIAKGSCDEVRSMLYLTKELKIIKETDFNTLFSNAEELSKNSFRSHQNFMNLKNRLPYASISLPELLFVCAKASVHFFSPITLLCCKCLLFISNITGWCKEYKIVVFVFRVQQQIKSLFTCSALFGGWRNNNGNFNNIGNNGNWWSSSENDTNNAWNLNMNSNNQNANINNNNKEWGFSVRCLQN